MKTKFHDRATEIVGLKIHGVRTCIDDDVLQIYYEEDNENYDCIGLYLILSSGLLEHVGDFPEIGHAIFMAEAIQKLQLDVPLEVRIKL